MARCQVERIIDGVVAAGMCDQVLVGFYRKNQQVAEDYGVRLAAEDDPRKAFAAAKGCDLATWSARRRILCAGIKSLCYRAEAGSRMVAELAGDPVFKYFQPVTAEAMEGEEQELVGPRLVLTSGLGCSGV